MGDWGNAMGEEFFEKGANVQVMYFFLTISSSVAACLVACRGWHCPPSVEAWVTQHTLTDALPSAAFFWLPFGCLV
jgi:hypothetical protein